MKQIIRHFKTQRKDNKNQIVIFGANDIGIHLAQTLEREDQNIILIDEKEEFLRELDEKIDVLTLAGNPLALETLKEAGVGKKTKLIAVTDSDNINLLLLFLGQSLGVKESYALIWNQECYQSFFPQVSRLKGKHYLINLWELVVQEIEQKSKLKLQILFINEVRGTLVLAIRFLAGHPLIGQEINQIKLGNRGRILKVINNGIFFDKEKNHRIESEDFLIIEIERSEQERVMRRWFAFGGLHKVMVGGEGLIQALKSHWPNFSKSMVCIEKDLIKCQQMLKIADHALILHGDGLDISLLKEAGIEKTSIFIAASHKDEINLLSSLLAKSFGVKDVITILRKRQHTGMLKRLKLEGIISIPQLVVKHLIDRIIFKKSGIFSIKLVAQIDNDLAEGLYLVNRKGILTPLTKCHEQKDNEIIILRLE
ncbi:hypothetical protein BBF96_04785 [Anoxybacter fermentans]|uniref:RCK N-terminal domain-containing protein n=1 Tax=Anoxybacter fermentans TaxID=1323375 RepID=A0A3S9SWP9_9FIRM|nr:NAD-binding protein [Anoxybacter fermentans]AZR72767.1 hypothetical protein BBF96_04785 [Anoxybacter fermentans]